MKNLIKGHLILIYYLISMQRNSQQKRFLFELDCIIFEFYDQELKLLEIKRNYDPYEGIGVW